MDKNKF